MNGMEQTHGAFDGDINVLENEQHPRRGYRRRLVGIRGERRKFKMCEGEMLK